MEPSASRPKRGVRKFLNKTVGKLLRRSPTPGSSQQPSRAPNIRSSIGYHESNSQNSLTPRNDDLTTAIAIVQSSAQTQLGSPAVNPVSASSLNEPPGVVGSTPMVDPPPMIKPPPVPEPLSLVESPPTAQLPLTVEPAVATTNPSVPVNDITAIPTVLTGGQTNNPTLPESRKAITGVWKSLDTKLRALYKATSLFPPVQSAISVFLPCLDEASRNKQEYKELTTKLISLTETLAQHLNPSTPARMSDSIARISRGIEEQCKLIDGKGDRAAGSGLLEADADIDEIDKCYRQIESLFRQLQIDASLSVWNIVNDQMTDTRLAKLSPVKLANYDSKLSTGISRRTCTEGTRTAILAGLNDWSCAPKAADIYWMNGMAGTGKTTIACTFAELLDERKQLAASFFCTRTVPGCRDVNRIIPTIAYQLAQYSIPYQSELCQVLASDPNIGAKKVVKQFERLVRVPLLKVKKAIPSSLVIAIDALDECDDMVEVELLLSVLLKSVADLPLRFFVTSRPEPEIYNRMLARGQGQRTVMHLHEVEKSLVQADIELYLGAELEFMSTTPSQIKELARRSGTLFIYAATLVRYIRSPKAQADPEQRLQDVLSMALGSNRQYAAIDSLYGAIVKTALEDKELTPEEAGNVRRVLHTVICIQEPVSIEVLAALVGANKERRVQAALESLRAVLYFSETTGLVSTLHTSFPDFLFDETRSRLLYSNITAQSQLVAERCFDVMKSQLRFNICSLESSFVLDHSIEKLGERVEQAISPTLWYACRYWGHHLKFSSPTTGRVLSARLENFLSTQLLFWMEVLNLKSGINMGVESLLEAKQWLQASKMGGVSGDIVRLAEDAGHFVASFASNQVSQSTPHIYISALPLGPQFSSVFREYLKKTKGLIRVMGSVAETRQITSLAEWNTGESMRAVSWSPDGSRIALGNDNGAVTIHNAQDGTLAIGPLRGHDHKVNSVVWSFDGIRVASGSWDGTIRVWNTQDGTLATGPLMGHTAPVYSVAYSPDGTRIVSGSDDRTIRIWDAHNGTLVVGPLKGHTKLILSVAYSPDGTRIVSGSSDHTVQVWNAHNGMLLAGPLKGHTDSVCSVAYSPDGARIVSGSSDRTIQIWDAHESTLVSGRPMIHSAMVLSVAYSPDGTRIVTGSRDGTIRVWNGHERLLVTCLPKGHTSGVWSVAYSPNGLRIVSCSSDGTARVWDAHYGTLVASQLGLGGQTDSDKLISHLPEGARIVSGSRGDTTTDRSTQDDIHAAGSVGAHTDRVTSVTYSSDGARIVSGSWDKTIRVWDARNGALLAGPFKGHSERVNSVSCSPDGAHIVSCSRDRTIRVWNAHDGTSVGGPLKGHTGSVDSVAYSPDGTRIASGSSDHTIRVWDAHDGTLVADPLIGHTDSVKSVAYSPDSAHILSGSMDKTIRIWDARGRIPVLVAGPLKGHTAAVLSVAYSPDGTRLVSGSSDQTLRVWNVHDGTSFIPPLEGHTHSVISVAYSPDGTRIISSSIDRTIRVWDAQDGTVIGRALNGHADWIRSVAYSPDGTRVVSGSWDRTIRVWDMENIPLLTQSTPHSIIKLRNLTASDGWVVDQNQNLLFWVPLEFRFAFITPRSFECLLLVAGPGRTLGIDYGDMLFGPRWDQCFRLLD